MRFIFYIHELFGTRTGAKRKYFSRTTITDDVLCFKAYFNAIRLLNGRVLVQKQNDVMKKQSAKLEFKKFS